MGRRPLVNSRRFELTRAISGLPRSCDVTDELWSAKGETSKLGIPAHPAKHVGKCRKVVDRMRRSLATELLENTHMGIEQVAARVSFADATSFRKAFKKWTNRSPSDFRHHERSERS
jgi:AraC-like DNA-binding protein